MKGNSSSPYRWGPQSKSGLVRKYLAKARSLNSQAQSYGGSTGGRSSIDQGSGINVLNRRSAEKSEKKKVFEQEVQSAFFDLISAIINQVEFELSQKRKELWQNDL